MNPIATRLKHDHARCDAMLALTPGSVGQGSWAQAEGYPDPFQYPQTIRHFMNIPSTDTLRAALCQLPDGDRA